MPHEQPLAINGHVTPTANSRDNPASTEPDPFLVALIEQVEQALTIVPAPRPQPPAASEPAPAPARRPRPRFSFD